MADKIRGNEVWWKSEKGNVAVVYSKFDLGKKYQVLRRVRDDAGWSLGWRFEEAFDSPVQALNYWLKSADLPVLVD